VLKLEGHAALSLFATVCFLVTKNYVFCFKNRAWSLLICGNSVNSCQLTALQFLHCLNARSPAGACWSCGMYRVFYWRSCGEGNRTVFNRKAFESLLTACYAITCLAAYFICFRLRGSALRCCLGLVWWTRILADCRQKHSCTLQRCACLPWRLRLTLPLELFARCVSSSLVVAYVNAVRFVIRHRWPVTPQVIRTLKQNAEIVFCHKYYVTRRKSRVLSVVTVSLNCS